MEQKVMIDMNNSEKPLFSTEGMFSMLRKRTAPATLAESKAQLEDSPWNYLKQDTCQTEAVAGHHNSNSTSHR